LVKGWDVLTCWGWSSGPSTCLALWPGRACYVGSSTRHSDSLSHLNPLGVGASSWA
jgi:hypothetical protein